MSGSGTRTKTFPKSEPESQQIITIQQHCCQKNLLEAYESLSSLVECKKRPLYLERILIESQPSPFVWSSSIPILPSAGISKPLPVTLLGGGGGGGGRSPYFQTKRPWAEVSFNQCWGSVTFWCGSVSPDLYLWLVDPDQDPTPDPTPFFSD